MRFQPNEWQLQITGVDVYPGYISDIQYKIYNKIIIGNIFDVLPKLGKFEVALISDVIEHFPKHDGIQLINQLFEHVEDIVISTPLGFLKKETQSVKINPYENHISGWYPEDFRHFNVLESTTINRINKKEQILVTYLKK